MTNKFRFFSVTPVIMLLLIGTAIFPQGMAEGEVAVVASFDPSNNEFPESIAIDKVGNIYVSLGPPGFIGEIFGQIRKIRPDGTQTVLVEYPDGPAPAGLAVDAPGNLYYALPSSDGNVRGVYRLDRDGSTERLPGTEHIILPNGLGFDKRGNLYISDSILGAVWRIHPGEGTEAEFWFQHEWLVGCGAIPVGANGVAFRKGNLHVANTSQGMLVRIPIHPDGSPGEPDLFAGEPNPNCDPGLNELGSIDGIALDVQGNIYAMLVIQNKLVRIDADDGAITTLLTEDDGLWNPASLAFGTGKGARESIFFTNYAVLPPAPPNNLGPAVLKFNAGVPGLPIP